MDGYICIKACTLGGTDYNTGDDIPAEAVLPTRVRALTRQGYLAPKTETQPETPTEQPETPQNEPTEPAPIVIPITTQNGVLELTIAPADIITAIATLQMNAEPAAKAVEGITSEDTLILIDALDTRKTVKTAILARVEAIKKAVTEAETNQGGDPNKEPGSSTPEQQPGGDSQNGAHGSDGQAGGQNSGGA